MYDAIVVGAGPAGLMACRTLQEEKINFLCVDKKSKIGQPLQCGEGIRQKEFTKFFGNKKYSFIKKAITKNVFVAENKKRTIFVPYFQIDRPEWEQWMAQPIKNRISLKEECLDIKENEQFVEITTNKRKIKAKTAIITTGPHYSLHKKLGLISKTPKLAVCYAGIFENAKINEEEFIFAYSKDVGLGGFWAFPKGNGIINAGFGALSGQGNLKNKFETIKKKIPGLEKIKPKKTFGGIFPASGPLPKTYTARTLVAGDAAGFTFAFSGEGIKFALNSGSLAAKTIAEAIKKDSINSNTLKKYEQAWKKQFGEELKGGTVFLDIAEQIYKNMPDKIEQLFMKPTDKELTNMINGKIPLRAKIARKILKTQNKTLIKAIKCMTQ